MANEPEYQFKPEKGWTIPILKSGYVRYIDHLGTDERIVEAARVSYGSASKGPEADKKLLKYLYTHRHTSPFEQCSITFNIKMPIVCMRQFVRHRTFRLNEWSGRYSKLDPEFYIPDEWRTQDTVNKQGSIEDKEFEHGKATMAMAEACGFVYQKYEQLLDMGVAKEMARFILPLNIFTEIYVNCDLHNLMHFLTLRMDSHAQKEIQEIAFAMHKIMCKLYPWTGEAFDDKRKPAITYINFKTNE